MLILRSDQVVLSAWMALTGTAPSHTVFNSHVALARSPGGIAAWTAEVNAVVNANFAGADGNARLADTVIANLGLGAVTGIRDAAIAFFNSQPANRGGLAIAAADWLRTVTPAAGDTALSSAQAAFRNAELGGFSHSTNPASVQSAATTPGAPITGGGQTFLLTAGADAGAAFIGTAGNDTFNAAQVGVNNAWTVGDAIDGGAGNDVFNVTQEAAITLPVGASVKNIETANLVSGLTGTSINTTTWAGLTNLNITAPGAVTATAAATTAVKVTDSALAGLAVTVNGGSTVDATTATTVTGSTVVVGGTTAAAGAVNVSTTTTLADGAGPTAIAAGTAVTVTGGTTVTVNNSLVSTGGSNDAGDSLTGGNVIVNGDASTTAVSVTQTAAAARVATAPGVVGSAAIVNGTVTVTDKNAASGTAAGTIATVTLNNFAAATIDSSAISTVNLTGTATSLEISRGALTATPTANTLAVNVNGLTMTGALKDGEAAADEGFTTVNIASNTAASSVASLDFVDATTLNISGDAKFTSNAEVLTAVTAINVTNTAGAILTTAIAAGVTFTGGAGADTVSLGATTRAITMGAGNDTVIYGAAAGTGGSVNAGDGIDTIQMSGAEAEVADNDSTFNSTFTNFEVLKIEAGATQTLDVVGLGNISKINTIGANGLVVNNLATGGTLTLTGVSTAAEMNVRDAAFNAADTFNIALSNSTAATVGFGTVKVAAVETINISTVDAGTGANTAATVDTATLVAVNATSIVVSGNNGLNLTNAGNAAVTRFDASGVVGNSTDDTAALLAVTFLSANTTATANVTITGGAGNDALTGSVARDTITGGEGADTISGAAGNDTIILTETTAAADTVVFALTAAANGIDTITGFAAGTGADIVGLVAAATSATTAGGAAAAFAASTNTTLTAGPVAFELTGATPTNTFDVIEITAILSSFGNLSAAGVVDGAELLRALSSTNVAAGSITSEANSNFYLVAYQGGNAFLYQVTNNADTAVVASEIALVGVFNGVAHGAFAAGDFNIV